MDRLNQGRIPALESVPRARRARRVTIATARWLAPSVVAACFAAIVGGALECRGEDTVYAMVVAAGFLALALLPILLVLGVIVRGLWAAWSPRSLDLVEDGGGAPRLAGWLGAIVLCLLGLGWIMFQGTWLLARWTAFKPMPMALAEPVLAMAGGAAAVVMARPLARGLAAIARSLDRRWRARGHASVITPARLVLQAAVALLAVAGSFWHFALAPRLGPLDTSPAEVPALALLAALFAHLAWRAWPRARRIAGPLCAGVAAVIVACALIAWRAQPSLTLAIWGDRPLAGLAIDTLFDLDRIRSRISLDEFRPTPIPSAPHPDIILVTIDTVRADHTPPYFGTADMPVLKELGKRGTVFDWAFSPSNVTRRSIPSMIIGLAPDRVRGRVVGWALRVDPRHVLVAERLEAGGYETAGFMCCEGFYGSEMHTGLERGLEHLEIEPNGLALARRARAWLEQRAKRPHPKPLFLWMHILEPHNWAVASGDPVVADARRKLYDRTLAQSDEMLAELLAPFAEVAPDKAPIVIVTADHGEGLGEHGQVFHSTDLYDSQTHVPLVIAGPGIKVQHVSETVSLTDLTPSLLELAGFAVPRGFDGTSFAGLATGTRAQDPNAGSAYAAMIHDRSNPGGWTMVVLGHYKLIDTPTGLELYDTRSDPGEHANLIRAHPPIYDALRKLLVEDRARGKRSPFP
ncbi:MAG: sulfatase-like hydrolase/transferase [Kofleriaceae bacterium]